MINREILKSEIDKVPKEYYGVLFNILKSIKSTKRYQRKNLSKSNQADSDNLNWLKFITQTYGSLSDSPIERGMQGSFESREEII